MTSIRPGSSPERRTYLRSGDVVEASVESLKVSINRVEQGAAMRHRMLSRRDAICGGPAPVRAPLEALAGGSRLVSDHKDLVTERALGNEVSTGERGDSVGRLEHGARRADVRCLWPPAVGHETGEEAQN